MKNVEISWVGHSTNTCPVLATSSAGKKGWWLCLWTCPIHKSMFFFLIFFHWFGKKNMLWNMSIEVKVVRKISWLCLWIFQVQPFKSFLSFAATNLRKSKLQGKKMYWLCPNLEKKKNWGTRRDWLWPKKISWSSLGGLTQSTLELSINLTAYNIRTTTNSSNKSKAIKGVVCWSNNAGPRLNSVWKWPTKFPESERSPCNKGIQQSLWE